MEEESGIGAHDELEARRLYGQLVLVLEQLLAQLLLEARARRGRIERVLFALALAQRDDLVAELAQVLGVVLTAAHVAQPVLVEEDLELIDGYEPLDVTLLVHLAADEAVAVQDEVADLLLAVVFATVAAAVAAVRDCTVAAANGAHGRIRRAASCAAAASTGVHVCRCGGGGGGRGDDAR